jgi:hypothetical protein
MLQSGSKEVARFVMPYRVSLEPVLRAASKKCRPSQQIFFVSVCANFLSFALKGDHYIFSSLSREL